jgi:hypothetical protein
MSIYKTPNPNLVRNITKNKASTSNYYNTTVINNKSIQGGTESNITILGDINTSNQVSNQTSGYITGGSNIVGGSGLIITGTGSNIQGDNIINSSSTSIVSGDNNTLLGGSNNNVNTNGNVLINTTGLNSSLVDTTFIGGDHIYHTTTPQNLIHILYGIESNFNYIKQIEIVDAGKDTVRPIYGDDLMHIVDGNANVITYKINI